jgi:RNA-directed DNA polymerase
LRGCQTDKTLWRSHLVRDHSVKILVGINFPGVWDTNVRPLLIGWLNYFSISKVTHIWETIKVIKKHLDYKLFKWMKSKGRKAHRKLRQRPYENLVKFYGLLDIEKYARLKTLAKAQ